MEKSTAQSFLSSLSEDDLVDVAKIAEHAERYEDMAVFMKEFTKKKSKLSDEERNLFSVAYKNVIGAKRSGWRILSSIAAKSRSAGSVPSYHEAYQGKIKADVLATCDEVLGLLEDLIKNADEPEGKVFYKKMKGDYHRYLCEVEDGEQRDSSMRSAAEAYNEAVEIGNSLASTSPLRLGVALNYSVFMYEIKVDKEKACKIAKDAFDDAIAELDSLQEKEYKDSTLIMQLLRDNLTLWKAEEDQGEDVEQEN